MVKSRINENQLTGSEKVICGLLIGVKTQTVQNLMLFSDFWTKQKPWIMNNVKSFNGNDL